MSRRTRWILVAAGLLAVIAGATYLLWTAAASRDFDSRVLRYRADGLPLSRAALAAPEIPESENAAGPLREAWFLVDELGDQALEVLELCNSDEDPPTEAHRAGLRARLLLLRPAIEKVHAALERPRLLLPLDAAMPASLAVRHEPVSIARDLLECEHRAGVLTTAATISALLDLTDRWVVQTRRETAPRRMTRASALRLLQAELEAGRPLDKRDAQRWSEVLARVESAEWEGVRAAFDDERVQVIEIVERARRGERLEAGVEILGPNRIRTRYAYGGVFDRLGLYRDAVEALDRIEPSVIRQKDEAALLRVMRRRRGPHPMHPLLNDYNTVTDLVEHLTAARLSRIAVQARLRSQDGAGLPDDLRPFAGVLGADAMRDPLTGEPFIWRRTDDGAVVMSPRAQSGYVKFGTWRVR